MFGSLFDHFDDFLSIKSFPKNSDSATHIFIAPLTQYKVSEKPNETNPGNFRKVKWKDWILTHRNLPATATDPIKVMYFENFSDVAKSFSVGDKKMLKYVGRANYQEEKEASLALFHKKWSALFFEGNALIMGIYL